MHLFHGSNDNLNGKSSMLSPNDYQQGEEMFNPMRNHVLPLSKFLRGVT